MDYSKPLDAELFPEGCERCSLTKFLGWMSFLGVIFLWGLYAAIRVLGFGLGETGMDDYFGFGLWITFDLAVIALGAGAFFTGALRYILNIDELKNIVNLAAVIGFLCYTGAMMILVLDIGQPIRCWFGYWYPNVHSMLTEVIFCITCYCIVLILEYVPLVLENRKLMQKRFIRLLAHNFHVYMPIFAGIGAFLSTFHQGSLGGMYGVLFGRPYLFREGFFIWPWTFFLVVLFLIIQLHDLHEINERPLVQKKHTVRVAVDVLVEVWLAVVHGGVHFLPVQAVHISEAHDEFAPWVQFLEPFCQLPDVGPEFPLQALDLLLQFDLLSDAVGQSVAVRCAASGDRVPARGGRGAESQSQSVQSLVFGGELSAQLQRPIQALAHPFDPGI